MASDVTRDAASPEFNYYGRWQCGKTAVTINSGALVEFAYTGRGCRLVFDVKGFTRFPAIFVQADSGTVSRAYHGRTKLTAVPFTSQAKGFFNKLASAPLEKLPEFHRWLYGAPENLARFERVKKVGAERSLSITQVALGYLLSQSFPVIPIVSCRHPAGWQDTLTAADVTLPPETVRYLEAG